MNYREENFSDSKEWYVYESLALAGSMGQSPLPKWMENVGKKGPHKLYFMLCHMAERLKERAIIIKERKQERLSKLNHFIDL